MAGILSTIGGGLKSAASTVGNAAGGLINKLVTGHADPNAVGASLAEPAKVNGAAFDVSGRADVQNLSSQAHDRGLDAQTRQTGAENQLAHGFVGPAITNQGTARTRAVDANTDRVDNAAATANRLLSASQGSRADQSQALALTSATAHGHGPSVAQGMIQQNAAQGARNIQQAGNQANAQFGLAANQAAAGYGDAFAQQQQAATQAATAGARTIQQSAEDSIRAQAALAAQARGGNIGASLLNAQSNAAQQMAGANRQAGQTIADAQQQAAVQAAAAQRAQALNQGNVNLQTGANLANASIEARAAQANADAQAAQIASQEQLVAQQQLLEGTTAARAGDVASTGAAVDIGQLGLGADTLATQTDVGNAERFQQNQQFGVSNRTDIAAQNAQLAAQNNQLNANILNDQANRSMAGQQFNTGVQTGLIGADVEAAQEQQRLQSQNYNAGQDRRTQFETSNGQNRAGVGGALLGAAGSVLGLAALSDKRAKRNIKAAAPLDFSGADPYDYEYKDPKAAGALTGKVRSAPMAQDLPKALVRKRKDGLLEVDSQRTLMALCSAVGALQKRAKADESEIEDDEDDVEEEAA